MRAAAGLCAEADDAGNAHQQQPSDELHVLHHEGKLALLLIVVDDDDMDGGGDRMVLVVLVLK